MVSQYVQHSTEVTIDFIQDDSTVLVHSIDPTMDINIITVSLVEVRRTLRNVSV